MSWKYLLWQVITYCIEYYYCPIRNALSPPLQRTKVDCGCASRALRYRRYQLLRRFHAIIELPSVVMWETGPRPKKLMTSRRACSAIAWCDNDSTCCANRTDWRNARVKCMLLSSYLRLYYCIRSVRRQHSAERPLIETTLVGIGVSVDRNARLFIRYRVCVRTNYKAHIWYSSIYLPF